MLLLIWDFVSSIGMLLYLEGLLTLLFRWNAQIEFFEKHPAIKNIYMTLMVIGFLRFVLAIPSLVN